MPRIGSKEKAGRKNNKRGALKPIGYLNIPWKKKRGTIK